MPLLKPQQVYARLGEILGLSGTQGLSGLQSEAVPTQDLTRVMQSAKVKVTTYLSEVTPLVDQKRVLTWSDASEWTEVLVDGNITTVDANLPQPADDRILAYVGLQISGTQADYDTGEANRFMPTTGGPTAQIAEFGAITTGHRGPLLVSRWTLPQWLVRGELNVGLSEEISGIASDWHWSFQMFSAAPGIMLPFSGT